MCRQLYLERDTVRVRARRHWRAWRSCQLFTVPLAVGLLRPLAQGQTVYLCPILWTPDQDAPQDGECRVAGNTAAGAREVNVVMTSMAIQHGGCKHNVGVVAIPAARGA